MCTGVYKRRKEKKRESGESGESLKEGSGKKRALWGRLNRARMSGFVDKDQ